MRLRSNTFMTLLLRAGHTDLSSRSENRGSNSGITRSAFFTDLIRLSLPKYSPKVPSTLVSYFSGFIQGKPISNSKYFPFSTTACRTGLADRIKNEYGTVLLETDAICRKYLDLSAFNIRLLVAGIVDTILADETFDGKFDIGGKLVDKAGLDLEDHFTLQPFLASVWNVILSDFPDTREGAQTYEAWTKDAGYNTPREITTDIGSERAKKIAVSVCIPERTQTDTAEEILEGETNETLLPPPAKLMPPGVETYLSKLANKHNRFHTILFREPLSPLRDYYVPNHVEWEEHVTGKQRTTLTRIINDGNILGVSKHIVLSGTGGLGKSMMMRYLLLTSVENYQSKGLIPFFISLRDYSEDYPSLLDFVFSVTTNLWPQLSKEGLTYILEKGNALLLFDGYDEIHSSLLPGFTKKMNDFLDRYTDNSFVISSRPYSNFSSISRSTVLYLKPLTFEQVLDLVQRYNYCSEMPTFQTRFRNELINRLFSSHAPFCTNPLLLSIMMMIYERTADVPTQKYLFYQEAYSVLSQRHDVLKDGYKRKLETGWNAEQFADNFSYFCATSYYDEKVSFTHQDMDNYFRQLIRKYNIEDVSLDNFISDATNNLCLMYRDGPDYCFIHRSFQEYFCAKFFSIQLDEKLTHIIPLFDRANKSRLNDSTFEMLFDMKPKAVEKYVVLPFLEEVIADCEAKDGIWTFLDRFYNEYVMSDGDLVLQRLLTKPESILYDFILNRYPVRPLPHTPDMLPGINRFIEQTNVFRDDIKKLDEIDNLPEDYEEKYGKPKETGHLYVIVWKEALRKNRECPSILKDFVTAVEDPERSFMAEYLAVKKLANDLRVKMNNVPERGNIFDLMD